jgi:hypothetical protein
MSEEKVIAQLTTEDLNLLQEAIKTRDNWNKELEMAKLVFENAQLSAKVVDLQLQVAYLNLCQKYGFTVNDKLDTSTGSVASKGE